MKILYVTTVGATMTFFKDFFKELLSDGHTVELACNEQEWDYSDSIKELGRKTYHIDCLRSPFSEGNIKCINQIRELVRKEQYDIVHCHTPIAAACTRIACKGIRKERKHTDKPLRVFYTAHGFHFYKGSPKKNWIIYYPIEKLCARWTDTLITINKEDYSLAKSKFEGLGRTKDFSGCKVEYVPGVGIDVDKFANTVVDKKAKRAELGIPEDAFVMLSVGELNENKNHQIIIRALAELRKIDFEKYKNYYYIIAGQGYLKQYLQDLIEELFLGDRVFLLGYRKDCPELYKVSDLYIHSSYREGLPVAVMEAQAAGTKCAGSNIRGNSDLIIDKNRFNPKSVGSIIDVISNVSDCVTNMKQYDSETIKGEIKELYGQT